MPLSHEKKKKGRRKKKRNEKDAYVRRAGAAIGNV
jgi:hypothetical protein